MVTIHHISFPHIIDLIFDFASVESHVALGKACRDWERRMLVELYHLREFTVMCDSGQSEPEQSREISVYYSFSTLSGQEINTLDPSALAGSRVIDVVDHLPSKMKERLHLQTVRLPQMCPPLNLGRLRVSFLDASRFICDNLFALSTRRRVDKLVIN